MQPGHLKFTVVLVSVMFLAGCASTSSPTRFYRLSSEHLEHVQHKDNAFTLIVGPVSVAPYLDRPQIISRSQGSSRLIHHEFDQWSGDLAFNMQSVISDELYSAYPKVDLLRFPQHDRSKGSYQLTVDVLLFDGVIGEEVSLKVDWSLFIYTQDSQRVRLISKRTESSQAISSAGIEGYVDSMSRALDQLVDEIIEIIAQRSELANDANTQ